jgi:hypothetical protein
MGPRSHTDAPWIAAANKTAKHFRRPEMFKSEAQQCQAIRILLGSLGFAYLWTDKGPTDQALDWLEGSPLSSGEKILLHCAFDFWGGHGKVLLYDLIGRLDEERTMLVLTLAMAVNNGPAAVDDWIEVQTNPQPIQCGQPERDAQVVAEAQAEMLKILEAARHCLKSYEFGNSATDPAHDMAERIEQVLRKNGIEVRF